ncbi:hypothetical protein glysoja_036256 [Glycine soja]|uniref:Uncharacterized protein n=1 Tax=Glycine soja TaxID=3848 RepID=A0A0B2RZ38_GLYSO|nr:hypothetical protein glysoja_036256 [Glycine soja]
MLDGILGRGFTAKWFALCALFDEESVVMLLTTINVFSSAAFFVFSKSLIKLTKSRIDVIRRKRRATEKFLKKDIADLLLNGLDINAYGRVIDPLFFFFYLYFFVCFNLFSIE